ncbi:GNAT family N-acetyltransferase [soil metagenome]
MLVPYKIELPGGVLVRSTATADAEQLEQLQNIVFPTLSPAQRFRAEHYQRHLEVFPEGQFVADAAGRIVGMTSTVRLDFDFENLHHTFDDIIEGGFLTSHQPGGMWLYGADIGTHPEFRGRGIARALYAARQQRVRQLGLSGQVTVGMMNGYGAVAGRQSAEDYYEALIRGDINDPTISAQRHIGFELRGLLRDYLDDPGCGNCGVLMTLPADNEI